MISTIGGHAEARIEVPNKRLIFAAAAPSASTANHKAERFGAGRAGSSRTALCSAVTTVSYNHRLLSRAARSQPRTVSGGIPSRSAIGRCPVPLAAASSAAPIVSASTPRPGTHQAGSSTCVRPHAGPPLGHLLVRDDDHCVRLLTRAPRFRRPTAIGKGGSVLTVPDQTTQSQPHPGTVRCRTATGMNGLRRDTEHTGQAHRKRPKVPWWSPPTTTLNIMIAGPSPPNALGARNFGLEFTVDRHRKSTQIGTRSVPQDRGDTPKITRISKPVIRDWRDFSIERALDLKI